MKRILKINKGNKKREKHLICVTGVASRLGASHTSLTIANYISSVLREPVLYIEPKKYSNLLLLVGQKQVEFQGVDCYRFKGVNYLFSQNIEKLVKTMLNVDAWVIVDLGELTEDNDRLFQICSTKIVIGSMMPWCRRDYQEFIRNKLIDKYDLSSISFYEKNISWENKREFNKIYGCKLRSMPIINDPFSLKEEEFEEIESII